MKAVRLIAWKTDPELVEVPKPTPGRGEVVVRERRLRSLRSSMDSLAGRPGRTTPVRLLPVSTCRGS
jgi:NADPH:quinone reductase-like Zn-dependent oxidoreductase